MKCPTCGEESEGLARCENCGTPLPDNDIESNLPSNSDDQKPIDLTESDAAGSSLKKEAEFSFDSELEFVDADSLMEDIKTNKNVPEQDVSVSPQENADLTSSDIIQPEEEKSSGIEEAFNELIDQEFAPNQEISASKSETEIELSAKQPDFAAEIQAEISREHYAEPEKAPESAVESQQSNQIPVETPLPPSSGSEVSQSFRSEAAPKQQEFTAPENTIPPATAEKAGIPASLYYQQQTVVQSPAAETTYPQAPPPADVYPKESFSTFVSPEPSKGTADSFFLSEQRPGSDNVTSYDFQPSIYYKQILGDSSADTGVHRDEIYMSRTEPAKNDEKEVPPSFARSFSRPDSNSIKAEPYARTTVNQTSFTQSRDKLDAIKIRKDDNKILNIISRILFIILAISSFFLMDVFATINSPLNPYDQNKSIRYIVFIFVVVIAIANLLMRNLGSRPIFLIPLFIAITSLFLFGITSLTIDIRPDQSGNFFFIDADPPVQVVEDNSFDATEPVIASSGKEALYSMRQYNSGLAFYKIGLIEFTVNDKKIESKLKDAKLEINGNAQWFKNDVVLYSNIKTELPTEMNNPVLMAAKNELYFDFTSTFNTYDFHNRISREYYIFTSQLPFSLFLKQILNKSENIILIQLSQIYTSPDKAIYNFVYNEKRGLISACYMGSIWLIDPVRGVSKKITRGGEPGSPFLDTWPKFNNTGDKILFVRTRIGEDIENDILQIDTNAALASEEPVLPVSVTNDNFNYLNFAVSPGGRFIAAWIFASQESGAKHDESALVLFDTKLNKHIKVYPLEQYDRATDQFISNIDWSSNGDFLLIQLNRLLHSSIKKIELPKAITEIDH